MIEKYTMVDLFCGAGIGAVGFQQAKFNIIDAIDIKQYAVNAYNSNIGNFARVGDLKELGKGDIPYADVFVGGFPCQPFSIAGSGKGSEDKNYGNLGYHFLRIIEEIKPKSFIGENVKGIITKPHQKFFKSLIRELGSIGYTVSWRLMNCYDYGVPQTRERVFIVGIRTDLCSKYIFPDQVSLKNRTCIKDAIGDLPDPDSNHNIKNHHEYYKGGFSSRWESAARQRQWNEPSYTILASARHQPLFPEPANFNLSKKKVMEVCNLWSYSKGRKDKIPRRFSVRECLRIQTVPDWFYFSEDLDLNKQYERCSGIPSLIARKLGENLKKCFEEKE